MPTKTIKLELPIAMLKKLEEIAGESSIFENREDVIIHAITDILEKYDKNGGFSS